MNSFHYFTSDFLLLKVHLRKECRRNRLVVGGSRQLAGWGDNTQMTKWL